MSDYTNDAAGCLCEHGVAEIMNGTFLLSFWSSSRKDTWPAAAAVCVRMLPVWCRLLHPNPIVHGTLTHWKIALLTFKISVWVPLAYSNWSLVMCCNDSQAPYQQSSWQICPPQSPTHNPFSQTNLNKRWFVIVLIYISFNKKYWFRAELSDWAGGHVYPETNSDSISELLFCRLFCNLATTARWPHPYKGSFYLVLVSWEETVIHCPLFYMFYKQ